MERLFTDFLTHLIVPPSAPLVACAAGVLLLRRRNKTLGQILAWSGILVMWLTSTSFVGNHLVQMLEHPPTAPAELVSVQAIVVLGGGRVLDSPEYVEDTVSDHTLSRLRFAARIARDTRIPVLVTGGSPYGGALSEGETMRRVLEHDFWVPVRWVEGQAKTTAESAQYSYRLLASTGVTRIALVSTAWHLPRAKSAFRNVGFDVVAAPTGYISRSEFTVVDFLPSAAGVYHTMAAMREMLGWLWYWCTGRI